MELGENVAGVKAFKDSPRAREAEAIGPRSSAASAPAFQLADGFVLGILRLGFDHVHFLGSTVVDEIMDLAIYNSYINALEKCYRVDEVKDLRDKAIALEHYARQAQNVDAERKAIEIRIRAERRAGQLLAEMERKPTAGLKRGPSVQHERTDSEYAETKTEAKISDTQAHRWQQLAAMPREDFERKLQDPLIKPSTTGLIKPDKNDGQASDRALFLWGQLRDFERRGVLTNDVNEILDEMSDALRADVERLVPQIINWLGGIDGTDTEQHRF